MSDGFEANSFRGIPIAIEHHQDGSVTLCEAVCKEIVNATDVPSWVKDLLYPPDSGQILFM